MNRRRDRDQGGAAAVEFALIALPLFLIIFGAIQYGYHYWSLQTAAASARELARELAVGNDLDACTAVAADRAAAPALGPVDIDVVYLDDTGATVGQAVIGGKVQVTVSFVSLDTLPVPLPRDADGDVVVSETAEQRVHDLVPEPAAC